MEQWPSQLIADLEYKFTTGWRCLLFFLQHDCLTLSFLAEAVSFISFLSFSYISVSVHQAKKTAEFKLEVRYYSSPGQAMVCETYKHLNSLIRRQIRPYNKKEIVAKCVNRIMFFDVWKGSDVCLQPPF